MTSFNTEATGLNRREAIDRLLAGGAMAIALPSGLLVAEDERIATAVRIGGTSHPLAPGLRLAVESRRSLDSVKDYSASFFKEEMVGGFIEIQNAFITGYEETVSYKEVPNPSYVASKPQGEPTPENKFNKAKEIARERADVEKAKRMNAKPAADSPMD